MEEAAFPQLRRGVLEFCVLALLRDRELYAFEIVERLGRADGLVTSEGTLYPLLGRLRREGVVETTWRESPSGPPRRYYLLTASGREALSAFTSEWTRFRTSVDALLSTGAADEHDHPQSPHRRLPEATGTRGGPPAPKPSRRARR